MLHYPKNNPYNCNYRRIAFHNKGVVLACKNTHINITYLNKTAYCYIEAVNLRSDNIYGS
jgi:hypothetical protein